MSSGGRSILPARPGSDPPRKCCTCERTGGGVPPLPVGKKVIMVRQTNANYIKFDSAGEVMEAVRTMKHTGLSTWTMSCIRSTHVAEGLPPGPGDRGHDSGTFGPGWHAVHRFGDPGQELVKLPDYSG